MEGLPAKVSCVINMFETPANRSQGAPALLSLMVDIVNGKQDESVLETEASLVRVFEERGISLSNLDVLKASHDAISSEVRAMIKAGIPIDLPGPDVIVQHMRWLALVIRKFKADYPDRPHWKVCLHDVNQMSMDDWYETAGHVAVLFDHGSEDGSTQTLTSDQVYIALTNHSVTQLCICYGEAVVKKALKSHQLSHPPAQFKYFAAEPSMKSNLGRPFVYVFLALLLVCFEGNNLVNWNTFLQETDLFREEQRPLPVEQADIVNSSKV